MATDDDLRARQEVLERIESWRRRAPRFRDETITMAHGAGGRASLSLIESIIRPALSNAVLDGLDDGAVLDLEPDIAARSRLVVTTDSFVVTPRRFLGGSIGDLAVNGTLNDLAAMGAEPLAITLSLVLEEGLSVDELRLIVADVAAAAASAGVPVVTGDTKVVERGAADGCYINTTGFGRVDSCSLVGRVCCQARRCSDRVGNAWRSRCGRDGGSGRSGFACRCRLRHRGTAPDGRRSA